MIKETVTYTDYNGVNRTEDFYFNMSKIDVMKMVAEGGDLQKRAAEIQELADTVEQSDDDDARMKAMTKSFDLITDIIKRAYGKKSDDGRRFIKSKELTEAFEQSEAYSELVMSMFQDESQTRFLRFVRGIMPHDLAAAIPEDMTPEEAKAKLAALSGGQE